MRKWITLAENTPTHEHPHARGEDEWFSFMWGSMWFNVDKCRRLIESGEVKAAKEMVQPIQFSALLGMDKSEFGSKDFEEPKSFDMLAAATSRPYMTGLPQEKLMEPAIIVMWKSLDGMKRLGYKIDKNAKEDKPSPWIIDGNHRLSRLYLEGYDKPVAVWIVPHEEALKFACDRYRQPLLSQRGAKPARP